MGNTIIYLDHAAATPIDSVVLEAMMPFFSEKFYNPSSPYAPGVMVRREYTAAKQRIARTLGVQADELVMTAGATESVNLAMTVLDGGVLAVGAAEHDSVRQVAKASSGVIIPVDRKGRITSEALMRVMRPDITLVSIGLANNEIGTIQQFDEIVRVIEAERARRRLAGEEMPLRIHCDASQALSLLDVKPKRIGVDLLTLSAAKVYGPKQVGALWVRPGIVIKPRILGGGQEMGLRSGTENVAGVVGFAMAVELAAKRRNGEIKRLRLLRDNMQRTLEAEFPDILVSSDRKKGLASFLHISFPGVDAERLIFLLEAQGVMVATGSACAANRDRRSHVLEAIGLSDQEIDGSVRITLGRLSTDEQVRRATELIIQAVRAEQNRSAGGIS